MSLPAKELNPVFFGASGQPEGEGCVVHNLQTYLLGAYV